MTTSRPSTPPDRPHKTSSGPVARVTAFAQRRPRTVLALWVLALALLAGPALSVEDHLAPTGLATDGTPSEQAQEFAATTFGTRATTIVLLEGPPEAVRDRARSLANSLRRDAAIAVATPFDAAASRGPESLRGLLQPDGRSAALLVASPTDDAIDPAAAEAVRRAVDETVTAPVSASLTGYSVIGERFTQATIQAIKDAEKIAIPALLLVLLLVLRTPLAAAMPLVLGVANVFLVLGLLSILGRVLDVGEVAASIGSMLGLALGVDYALLVIARQREHVREGCGHTEALAIAGAAAGRTVTHAALALLVVMAGAALLSSVGVLRWAAVGVTLAGLGGLVLALTALPALLALAGPRVDRWRLGPPAGDGTRWGALAALAMRRPIVSALPAFAVLLALAPAALGLETGPPDPRTLPADDIARVDGATVAAALGAGWAAPIEVTLRPARDVDPRAAAGTRTAERRWLATVRSDPRVRAVLGPRGSGATEIPDGFTRAGDARRYTLVPAAPPNAPEAADLVDDTRAEVAAFARPSGATTAVGGVAAELTDMRRSVSDSLLLVVAGLTLITTLALIVVLRTVLLPVISVLLNLITVAAAFGVLGLLSTGTDPISGGAGFADQLTILATFAIVFALSLDYQVFILSRVLEEARTAPDAATAVSRAIGRTAGVITGAAAIMCAVFLAFTVPDLQTLRQSGIVLVAAIAIDATLVRLVLLPAALGALGSRWLVTTRATPSRPESRAFAD
jgi:RND superfamily putative drug exporter